MKESDSYCSKLQAERILLNLSPWIDPWRKIMARALWEENLVRLLEVGVERILSLQVTIGP
jgi:hypothetical protein